MYHNFLSLLQFFINLILFPNFIFHDSLNNFNLFLQLVFIMRLCHHIHLNHYLRLGRCLRYLHLHRFIKFQDLKWEMLTLFYLKNYHQFGLVSQDTLCTLLSRDRLYQFRWHLELVTCNFQHCDLWVKFYYCRVFSKLWKKLKDWFREWTDQHQCKRYQNKKDEHT